MTYKEATQLKDGDRVTWDKNPEDLGTVQDIANVGVKIAWDNGQKGWIDFRAVGLIEKAVTS